MSHNANKYKLGTFVVAAFVIFLISLFLLGALNIFKERIHCITVVKGSVQGLAVGAKVKYNGVPIGEVTKIQVSPIGQNVYIYMDIFPENLNYSDKGNVVELFTKYIGSEIKKGLRCQLRYEGITGALYQELQYFPLSQLKEKENFSLPVGHPIYIPSLPPVLFDNIIKRIDQSLAKLSGIDKIFSEVNITLKKVNSILTGEKVTNAINDFEITSKNISTLTNRINSILTDDKVKTIIANFEEAMKEIGKLAKNVNSQLMESDFPSTASDIRDSVKDIVNKLIEAINNFNAAAKSIEELSDELNSSPNSLIWGKEKEQVVPPR